MRPTLAFLCLCALAGAAAAHTHPPVDTEECELLPKGAFERVVPLSSAAATDSFKSLRVQVNTASK